MTLERVRGRQKCGPSLPSRKRLTALTGWHGCAMQTADGEIVSMGAELTVGGDRHSI